MVAMLKAKVQTTEEQPRAESSRHGRKHQNSLLKNHGLRLTEREGPLDKAPLSQTWTKEIVTLPASGGVISNEVVPVGTISLYIFEFSSAARAAIKEKLPEALHNIQNGIPRAALGEGAHMTFTSHAEL